MTYSKINNVCGWAIFAIALTVYLLTVAPTASFWDCGEFIACANELEVTHPPGAPLFLLLGRLFAMMAGGDVTHVAYMVNLLSVFASAFTVLFIFWTTTMLAKKGLAHLAYEEETKTILGMMAGGIAALACTFTDSFWYNAVEAEVYALSSTFTALSVWLIFKWEARADRPDNLKWLILIAYIMGLSIGVHLLNLLTIPAMALVYYFKKYEYSPFGLLAALGGSVLILALIQYGIIQYTFSFAWAFEKLFTGTVTKGGEITGGWGLPIGTGFTFFLILLIGAIIGLLIYTSRHQKVLLNTAVLCFTVILIGFSSYSIVYIRSNADPGIDMNNPENLLTFLSYMKREQYGDRPLLYGPLYNGQIERDSKGRAQFTVKGKKYILLDGFDRYVEDVEDKAYRYTNKVLFPRMYDPGHYSAGGKNYPFKYSEYVSAENKNDPKTPYDDTPSRIEDFRFFIDYQLNHMYLRYFMWNFVGRTSDVQDAYWEDGLIRRSISNNKGNNHYFFIPLLLGIMGLIWQLMYDEKNGMIIGLLFFFMGIAIIIYLNQWPLQPRERDYSFAGSFQTFTIWIGLGVLALYEILRSYMGKSATYLAGGLALCAPLLMGVQNWDDHTRKGRYIDIEFAKNLLNSCAPNAILFTGGDNDTFPLWYVQEVEGYRDDVRVVNLELLISDWYIDQMKQTKNNSPSLPIHMEKNAYAGEKSLVLPGYPSHKINIPLDSAALVDNKLLSPEEASVAGEVMVWDFKSRGSKNNPYILRKDSVVIELVRNIAASGWDRPIYYGNTMSPSNFLNLQDYLRLEGMAYRLVPLKKNDTTANDLYFGHINQEKMFKNLTENFLYTELDNPKVYFDEHIRSTIVNNYRNSFFRLANSYVEQIQRLYLQLETARATELEKGGEPSPALVNLQQRIDQKREKVRVLFETMEEKIPREVIIMPINLALSMAQVLDLSGDEELADQAFLQLSKEALDRLEVLIRSRIRITQENPSFSASLYSIQYFTSKGKQEEAQQIAGEFQSLTGSDIGFQIIDQGKNQ